MVREERWPALRERGGAADGVERERWRAAETAIVQNVGGLVCPECSRAFNTLEGFDEHFLERHRERVPSGV